MEVTEETQMTGAYPVTFTLAVDKPVERIVFLHESSFDQNGLRTVLETESGETLWRGTHPEEIPTPEVKNVLRQTGELVNLEDEHVEHALHFRVRHTVASDDTEDTLYRELSEGAKMARPDEPTTVEAGWFRRISNVRIEYTDGTAKYPHR